MKVFKKILFIIILFMCSINVYAKEVTTQQVNNPNKTSQELKVLIIEINPILTSITNTSMFSNNGHPKVSEWFGHDVEASINEIKKDIQDASHGYINVKIVKREYLNEFPKYKKQVTLLNGTASYSYDEQTYISMGQTSNPYKGDWYKLYQSSLFKVEDSAGNFDYEYLISKFDLVNRRNRNEFDQVWIFNISPIGTYETMMVGRNAYWINGSAITKSCDNFAIVGLEIARRDTMFHSFGHMTEQILKRVFGQSKDIYGKGVYSVNSKEDYNKLNLWEKFTLTAYNNNTNYTSVGNTHFPYNATKDYDVSNSRKVYTNYKEWLNYPNITGSNFELRSATDFLNDSINNSVNNSSTQTKAQDRLYQRFWFSLLPHITGYTNDGYSNNWWKYWYSLDYVTSVKSSIDTNVTAYLNEKVNVNYDVTYYSGKKETFKIIPTGNNVSISNSNILELRDGSLYAKGVGSSNVTVYYDGKSVTYNVKVENLVTPVVTLNEKKNLVYNGLAQVANTATTNPKSTGAITYTYYTDSNCSVLTGNTQEKGLAKSAGDAPIAAGTWYVKAIVAEVSGVSRSATSGCVKHVISKSPITLTINPVIGMVDLNEEITFTVTPTVLPICKGTMTITSADKNYVIVSSESSIQNITTPVTIKWKGIKETPGKKINIDYTTGDKNNCSNATQIQYTAVVNNGNLKVEDIEFPKIEKKEEKKEETKEEKQEDKKTEDKKQEDKKTETKEPEEKKEEPKIEEQDEYELDVSALKENKKQKIIDTVVLVITVSSGGILAVVGLTGKVK